MQIQRDCFENQIAMDFKRLDFFIEEEIFCKAKRVL